MGLAWIAEPSPYRPAGEAPAKTVTMMEDVRNYLARQEREMLVRMILDKAMEDTHRRSKLNRMKESLVRLPGIWKI